MNPATRIEVVKELVIAEQTRHGYSWTIASRLGDMLTEAEARFGPRSGGWYFVGWEFGPGSPQTWYPGSGNHIAIQLSDAGRLHAATALWELAHEVIHLLAPPGRGRHANRLEEGVATAFQNDYAAQKLSLSSMSTDPKYIVAEGLVRDLLAADAQAIKRLRAVQPCFCDIAEQTFQAAGLTTSHSDIKLLLAPF